MILEESLKELMVSSPIVAILAGIAYMLMKRIDKQQEAHRKERDQMRSEHREERKEASEATRNILEEFKNLLRK